MLATLGVITILCLLTAVMSKRLSPLVALIALPIIAALLGGFGLQTSAFIITGIKNVAPVVGMFVFATRSTPTTHAKPCRVPSAPRARSTPLRWRETRLRRSP